MVGGGLMAIFFVLTLVAWAMWSLVYFTFAAHYFLTTLTDSSSGLDDVQYPRESVFDWWWKPIFCAWVFIAWATPTTILLSPVAMFAPAVFPYLWFGVMWFIYPLS